MVLGCGDIYPALLNKLLVININKGVNVKFLLIVLCLGVLSSCASLEPSAVSSNDLHLQQNMEYSSSPEAVSNAVKKSFASFNWKLLYEGETLPAKNYSSFSNMSHNLLSKDEGQYDQMAFDKILSADQAPSIYLQAKTPTSAFSYGAEVFVVVYKTTSGGSVVAISASSGQALEKKKLSGYVNDLSNKIQELID